MTQLLKQSTAATIKLGPFVDSTDGVTAETALTISQADIRLTKNGGAFAQTNNAAGATHDENGYYGVPLDTTDTGTLGRLRVAVNESGALPVWQDFMVVPANVYDSLVGGSDKLQVHADEITAGLITATAIASNAIAAAKIAADAGNKIADHVLRRNNENVEASSDGDTLAFRSLEGLVAKGTNKCAPVGSNLVTYKADDVTSLGSQSMTTNPAADPITALDTN